MLRQKIKQALKQRGLAIRKMCLELGLRQASVSEFLSGKRQNISVDKLEKVLIFLEIIK